MLKVAQLFCERAKEALQYALPYVDKMKVEEIYVFGSLARGDPYPNSDVDLMFLVNGDVSDVNAAEDFIYCDLSANYEVKYPRVDAHACRVCTFYSDNLDDETVFGCFIAAVREDGILIWKR